MILPLIELPQSPRPKMHMQKISVNKLFISSTLLGIVYQHCEVLQEVEMVLTMIGKDNKWLEIVKIVPFPLSK